MYYSSNNTVIDQPIFGNWGTNDLKSAITYIVNHIIDKMDWIDSLKQGINNNVVGYNSEKYYDLEKVYSMTYDSISSLAQNYVVANRVLDEILNLEDDWNNNGAQIFSAKLVEKCRQIVNQLAAEPFVCPTACGSIQFEYEKDNGEYLEFEIYEDRIEVYIDMLADGEKEITLCGISATDKMKQMVVDFYG